MQKTNMGSDRKPPPTQPPQVSVILMGGTGTGKTTVRRLYVSSKSKVLTYFNILLLLRQFTNLVGGANFLVGNGLESCTSQIQSHKFSFEGRDVTIIDVPGFDDSSKSDIDILKIITEFLATEYKAKRRLTGILYFHRISDVRMGGASRRNYTMFEKLVGPALPNVSIVTTRWDEDQEDEDQEDEDQEEAAADQKDTVSARLAMFESRFEQLRTMPTLFKSAVDGGGTMFRHNATAESAYTILRHALFSNPAQGKDKVYEGKGSRIAVANRRDRAPVTLQIQKELVDEGKELSETAAGEELHRDIKKQMEKHQKEMEELLEQMQEINDGEDLEELQRECQELKERMAHWYQESEKINMGPMSGDSGSGSKSDQVLVALEGAGSVTPPPSGPHVLPPPTKTSHISSTAHPPPRPSPKTNHPSLITHPQSPREPVGLHLVNSTGTTPRVVGKQAVLSTNGARTDEIPQETADFEDQKSSRTVEDKPVRYSAHLRHMLNQTWQKIWRFGK
ncbi:hypothetical protein D9757_011614 [Collybiopsis confluens]|uniref:G domain-containing protein n=1 Tax=Collybiopsis confluens TaxID=2823264 RepID=A0A8H5GWK6_9AGAR|nr:hypothetical protein D9757_011614 [Collybiopsis confluens]